LPNNNIKILVHESWSYFSHIWIYPKNWDDEKNVLFLEKELNLWR
jgi:hypothetical protein